MPESLTVWLAKYALADGLKSAEATPSSAYSDYVKIGIGWNLLKLGRDVFEDRAEAVLAVEAMRLKKIASLKRQIAKLENLDASR